jgi:RNA-directed DNA polymerase
MNDSTDTTIQTRGVDCRRDLMGLPFDENLFERILSSENLHAAFKRVAANKGSAGVDGVETANFREWAKGTWTEIRRALFTGTYVPSPILRCEIPKSNGGVRKLGIPTVMDRVIQQAISQVLTGIFDPEFSDYSFGFRPNRSAHQAVLHLQESVREGYRIAVDVDLEKFFDTVNHDLVMSRLSRKISDRRVLKLIGRYLRAPVKVDGRLESVQEGVPQGGPLSPLLANIMLDDFDKELEARGHRFARYADDFIILVKSKLAGERVMRSVRNYLQRRLKLKVNEAKSQVVPTHRCSFLGFTFRGEKIIWTRKAFDSFKRKLRRLTSRTWGVSMQHRMWKLRQYIQGWMGYYRLSECPFPLRGLDSWLRRRIRMCYLKMWGRPRTMIRRLLSLGCSIQSAVGLGRSSKSWIRKSKNPVINWALSNRYLASQGLISIQKQWGTFHHSR